MHHSLQLSYCMQLIFPVHPHMPLPIFAASAAAHWLISPLPPGPAAALRRTAAAPHPTSRLPSHSGRSSHRSAVQIVLRGFSLSGPQPFPLPDPPPLPLPGPSASDSLHQLTFSVQQPWQHTPASSPFRHPASGSSGHPAISRLQPPLTVSVPQFLPRTGGSTPPATCLHVLSPKHQADDS